MITQVKAWGNSQGIRLSKEFLALAEIKANENKIKDFFFAINYCIVLWF